MMSISHWGMFQVAQRVFVVPADYRLADHDSKEWNKPDGVIRLERIK